MAEVEGVGITISNTAIAQLMDAYNKWRGAYQLKRAAVVDLLEARNALERDEAAATFAGKIHDKEHGSNQKQRDMHAYKYLSEQHDRVTQAENRLYAAETALALATNVLEEQKTVLRMLELKHELDMVVLETARLGQPVS